MIAMVSHPEVPFSQAGSTRRLPDVPVCDEFVAAAACDAAPIRISRNTAVKQTSFSDSILQVFIFDPNPAGAG